MEVEVFRDELDAQQYGEAFIQKHLSLGSRIHYTEDLSAQMPKIKWCGLFDHNDRLVAGYLLNRDLKNYCQVSCFLTEI